MTLGEYLKEAGGKAASAGEHDCCTFTAGWAIICGWPDPLSGWRGGYDGREASVVERAGGLLPLFERALAAVPIVDEPRLGDIGVVDISGMQTGGIFTGRRWAFAASRGIVAASIDPENVLKVWRPCRS